EFQLMRDTDARGAITVTVHNLMPGAELVLVGGGSASVGKPVRTSETRATWPLEWSAGTSLHFRVGPEDASERSAFEFALLNDVQEAIDGFHEMIARVNGEPDVRFVLGAGDLTSNGTVAELSRFKRELEAM